MYVNVCTLYIHVQVAVEVDFDLYLLAIATYKTIGWEFLRVQGFYEIPKYRLHLFKACPTVYTFFLQK